MSTPEKKTIQEHIPVRVALGEFYACSRLHWQGKVHPIGNNNDDLPLVVAGAIAHVKNSDVKELNRNLRWVLGADFFEAGMPSVVMITAESIKPLFDSVKKLEYYENQKGWVMQAMKKEKRMLVTAAVAKQAVITKIRAAVKATVPLLEQSSPLQPELDDMMRPKFYQIAEKGWSLTASSNFGLSDCRLNLEGSETVFGIPLVVVAGATIMEKEQTLNKMTVQQFLSMVDQQGFSYHASVGALYIIPGRFATITLGGLSERTHGLQWFVPGGPSNIKQSLDYMNQLQKESPYADFAQNALMDKLSEFLIAKLG